MIEIVGYASAIVMGIALGLIGGGGSILTMPILVYLFAVDAVLATAYSLFIVGLTSLVGSVSHMRMGNIHWRTAIVFGIPSVVSVYLTRLFVVPMIPNELVITEDLVLTKSIMLLLLFALVMLAASYSMIRKKKSVELEGTEIAYNYPLIFLEGTIVGVVTGIVGAGGGFLIIPALVLLAKLPMKQAVGTSLVIIAAKSLIGFTGDLQGLSTIDWSLLLTFTSIAIVGILIGATLSKLIPNERLKPAFGWFILIMGIYIISKELYPFLISST